MVSITETRRQVEQAQAFNEQQALRRSKEREDARDAALKEEAAFRGIVEDRRAADAEADVVQMTGDDPPDVPDPATPDAQVGTLGLDVLA